MLPTERTETMNAALANLTAELARINAPSQADDARAQLAQVQARIADALASRRQCEAKGYSAATWRTVNERLHRLYVMESEIKADIASLA